MSWYINVRGGRGAAPAARRLQQHLVAERPGAQPRIAVAGDGGLERCVIGIDANGDALLEGAPAREPRSRCEQPSTDAADLRSVRFGVEQLEEHPGRLDAGGERKLTGRATGARRGAGGEQGGGQAEREQLRPWARHHPISLRAARLCAREAR
jgi:hypothetical protein